MPTAAYIDAYVKYATQFPTLLSLGAGDPPAEWAAELSRVAPAAFDQIKATSLGLEGGSLSGVSNFDQMLLVRALYAVRAARDENFENPYVAAIEEPVMGRRQGFVVRLGY